MLNDNNRFKESVICFGTHDTEGKYQIKADTILLSDAISNDRDDEAYYEFALVKRGLDINDLYTDTLSVDTNQYLYLYKNHSDTAPLWLYVSHNTLFK